MMMDGRNDGDTSVDDADALRRSLPNEMWCAIFSWCSDAGHRLLCRAVCRQWASCIATPPARGTTCALLARADDLVCLRWAARNGWSVEPKALTEAVRGRSVRCLAYLTMITADVPQKAVVEAASVGWWVGLDHLVYDSPDRVTQAVAQAAAKGGHPQCLELLCRHRCWCDASLRSMARGACRRHVDRHCRTREGWRRLWKLPFSPFAPAPYTLAQRKADLRHAPFL